MIHLKNVHKRFRRPEGGWFDAVRDTTEAKADALEEKADNLPQ